MAEHATSTPPRKGTLTSIRQHPIIAATVAIIGFLGFGSVLGAWLLDQGSEVVRGPAPPTGFDQIYAEWRAAGNVSEELLETSRSLTDEMELGTGFAGIAIPPVSVEDELAALARIQDDASALEGRVEAASTELIGPQGDLARFAVVVGRMARLVEDVFWSAYRRTDGEPWSYGSGGFGPLFSNRIAETVEAHHDQVRQIDAGLRPLASRFEQPPVEITGWQRIPFPYAHSDEP